MHTHRTIVAAAVCAAAAGLACRAEAGVDLSWTQRGATEPSSPRTAWLSGDPVERLILRHNNSVTRDVGNSRDPVRWLNERPKFGADAGLGDLMEHSGRTRLTYDRMAWLTVVQVLHYQPGRGSPDTSGLLPTRAEGPRDFYGQGNGGLSGGAGTVHQNFSRSDGNTPHFLTVPEPTTLALCAGLAYAALVRPSRPARSRASG